jgi:hypothetical protein
MTISTSTGKGTRMNGRTLPVVLGVLISSLITGLISMASFGRQLTRVETEVKQVSKDLDSLKRTTQDHQRWHLENKNP